MASQFDFNVLYVDYKSCEIVSLALHCEILISYTLSIDNYLSLSSRLLFKESKCSVRDPTLVSNVVLKSKVFSKPLSI